MGLVLGSLLRRDVQRKCLARFVHRYTRDHKPFWAERVMADGRPYPVQFRSDLEWLANTRFSVTKSGDLDERVKYCESSPTWCSS